MTKNNMNLKNKKNIIIIIIILVVIGGYYITVSDWFQLWWTPGIEGLTSEEITEQYNKFLQSGIDKDRDGDPRGAILDYKKALKIAPGSFPPKNNIAESCIKLEDYQCAEEWFLEIVKRGYDPGVVVKLSKLYKTKIKDNEKAVDILMSAHEAFPESFDFIYNLGFLHWQLANKEEGLKYLNMALEINPDDQNIKDLINDLNK